MGKEIQIWAVKNTVRLDFAKHLSYKEVPEAAAQRCYEEKVFGNMRQIYGKTPIPKCDFNKVGKQLY